MKSGSREQRWMSMSLQYMDFDRRIEEFSRESGTVCPSGCGICCTSAYEPEVTAGEAEFAARYIIEARPDLETRFEKFEDRQYCIFYDEHNPYHCMIYSARPVICRGFGFSGYTDKNGNFTYRPCRNMEKVSGDSLFDRGPIISDYQAQYTLDYHEKLPISEAIFTAWQKLCYYDSLELESGDDYD